MPKAFVPVYALPAIFRRAPLEHPSRPEPRGPVATPAWAFDAGAPIWADTAFADDVVYVGADDGRLHALEAKTGKELWAFRAGGPIRARVARAGGDVFVQADDGNLYKLDAATGAERFRVAVNAKPIERLPPGEKSRFDRVASAATAAGGRLYLGTHDGHVLALDPGDGRRLWDFAAGDLVLSTPVVDGGRVYFGSFDGNVYAVDAASGALVWKHDTGAAVTSTPALYDGRVIVGSRSYDLLALDGKTGAPGWTRYVWFSWVESPASILGGTAYVGSSDAAQVYALDARSGRSHWEVDVHGWAWGQPAVTEERVFVGTSATPHYLVGHDAAFLAVDRASGTIAWRFPMAKPADEVTYGFSASAAVGDGLVFAGALDGKVYAFTQ
jgi:outer membrane protein assembly factor BamB